MKAIKLIKISVKMISFLAAASLFFNSASWGAESAPLVGNRVGTGKGAAAKYLAKEPEAPSRSASDNGMLMLQVGPFTDSVSYAWKGSDKRTKVGSATYGVTYLFDQWNSIDVNFRGEFTEYKIDDQQLLKLSLMPLWTFPMWESHFPLYFGLGAGLGIFFKQVESESNLAFDYQLVLGVRVPELLQNAGFAMEFGMKNHLHLLSDGQFNGTTLTVGTVFTF